MKARLCLLRDVAAGLARLHGLGIIHRDIALRNVLIRSDGQAQLGDFGLSRSMREGRDQTTANHPLRNSAPVSGALLDFAHAAAEQETLLRGAYSPASDMFAFGLLVVELMTGLGSIRSRHALRRREAHREGRAAPVARGEWLLGPTPRAGAAVASKPTRPPGPARTTRLRS